VALADIESRTGDDLVLTLHGPFDVPDGAQVIVDTRSAEEPRLIARIESRSDGRLVVRVGRVANRDRRIAPRYDTTLDLTVENARGQRAAATPGVEIALGGLAFDTELELDRGEEVRVSFPAPGSGRVVHAQGRVVRTSAVTLGGHRIAVALAPAQPEAFQVLHSLSAAIQDQLLDDTPKRQRATRSHGRRGPVSHGSNR
jgi:multidrug efflux pump subunit AcrA (membrane-fusion protein)